MVCANQVDIDGSQSTEGSGTVKDTGAGKKSNLPAIAGGAGGGGIVLIIVGIVIAYKFSKRSN